MTTRKKPTVKKKAAAPKKAAPVTKHDVLNTVFGVRMTPTGEEQVTLARILADCVQLVREVKSLQIRNAELQDGMRTLRESVRLLEESAKLRWWQR